MHPNQIAQWKKQALEELPQVFRHAASDPSPHDEKLIASLYQQIGQLKVEVDFLKKNQVGSLEAKRALIEPARPGLSIARQCALLGMARGSYYYEPVPVSEENVQLTRLLDEQYTRYPFYGTCRMTAWLQTQGYAINRKRVTRLLREMGVEAISPKPHLSQAGQPEVRYPYLLRNRPIERVNEVWSSDIIYIRLVRGFLYLVAVMDWFSCYVLAWELLTTLDTSFCLEALERALQQATLTIFNTDQGVQFTSQEFTHRLKGANVQISWDG